MVLKGRKNNQRRSDTVSEMLSLKDVRVTAGSSEIPLLPAKWPHWQERQSGPFLSGATDETARGISENGVAAKDSNGRAPAEPLLPLPLPSFSPLSFRRARGTLSPSKPSPQCFKDSCACSPFALFLLRHQRRTAALWFLQLSWLRSRAEWLPATSSFLLARLGPLLSASCL
jgi:hypothetical protein